MQVRKYYWKNGARRDEAHIATEQATDKLSCGFDTTLAELCRREMSRSCFVVKPIDVDDFRMSRISKQSAQS